MIIQSELLVQEAIKHGGIWVAVFLVLGALLWNVAITYTNLKYMKANMVTKKDLEISLLEHEKELEKKFVMRREFNGRKFTAGSSERTT